MGEAKAGSAGVTSSCELAELVRTSQGRRWEFPALRERWTWGRHTFYSSEGKDEPCPLVLSEAEALLWVRGRVGERGRVGLGLLSSERDEPDNLLVFNDAL